MEEIGQKVKANHRFKWAFVQFLDLLKWPLLLLIKTYQYLLSPLLAPRCRFYPSCSHYAVEALGSQHFLRALWLIIYRIIRCHPLHPGGYDPVPSTKVTKR